MSRVIDEIVVYLLDQRNFLIEEILKNERVILLDNSDTVVIDFTKEENVFNRKEVAKLNGFIDELEHIYKVIRFEHLPEPDDDLPSFKIIFEASDEPSDFEIGDDYEDEIGYERDDGVYGEWCDDDYEEELEQEKIKFDHDLDLYTTAKNKVLVETVKSCVVETPDEIKVGDIVRVKEWANSYSMYFSFVEQYGTTFQKEHWRPISIFFDGLIYYTEKDLYDIKNMQYQVTVINKHTDFDRDVAIIQNNEYVWVIDVIGLEKVKENE